MQNLANYILENTPEDVVRRYEALPVIANCCDFCELDRNVVVIDTETTGLSFNHDELIQIAAARLERGEIVEWFITFVDPGKKIPDDIVHLTGITDTDVKNAPSPDAALKLLSEFVGDSLIVAHNVEFDKTFVTKHPSGYPLLNNKWVDSLELSRISLPRLKSHRLIDLVRAFDAPISTHRADDDVASTCVVYRILLAAIASMPYNLVNYIASMSDENSWSTSYAFKVISKNWKQIQACIDATKGVSEDEAEAANRVSRETYASNEQEESKGHIERLQTDEGPKNNGPYSLLEMRKNRMLSLPSRKAKRDADELVGLLEYPSKAHIVQMFTPEGIIGRIYSRFESRTEQVEMAAAIADALEHGDNLVVEAGTGVGKSMAYLAPMVELAIENDICVGIATKTNSLLDQLVYQELPALAKSYQRYGGRTITWAPIKGMSHYPCLRKTMRLADSGPGFREVMGRQLSQAPALAALLSFIEQSEYDDLDSLKIDYRALPRYQFTTTSQECLRRKCPFFGRLCFVHGARRRAETADVVVTNHSLLFCDVETDGGLLPTIRHWVIDEAHSCENEARDAFAETVDSEAISRLVAKVGSASSSRNVFDRAERSIERIESEQLTLFFGLLGKAKMAGQAFSKAAGDYFLRVKDLLFFDPVRKTRRGQSYERVDIWINDEVRGSDCFKNVALCAMEFIEESDRLIKACTDLVAYLEGIDEAAVAQREIAVCAFELRNIRNAVELIFCAHPESHAYQAALNRKKDRYTDKLQALLLDVGDRLNETLYANSHTVVYASATLTVGGKFDSFQNAVGLNRSEFSASRAIQLDSCFDFDNNMIVYVVSDMPEPNDPDYLPVLCRFLAETHIAQKGSMLTLFTNRREMENAFKEVEPQLKEAGLRAVCQKYGLSVKGLKDEFLSDEHLSLFALKSFWEGFDAPGSTLKGVIIPKLPFARPTDPLYCERASRDERAWWRYVLPNAVIETKQAAGRLIRKSDDHGVLILADKRLLTKSYGKTFLRSLQSKTVRVCTQKEIITALSIMGSW